MEYFDIVVNSFFKKRNKSTSFLSDESIYSAYFKSKTQFYESNSIIGIDFFVNSNLNANILIGCGLIFHHKTVDIKMIRKWIQMK